MGKRNRTPVSGNEVRVWGQSNGFEGKSPREGESFPRGRISRALVEAYEAANPGHEYTPGHTSEPTVTLIPTGKNGRKLKPRTVSLTEARQRAERAGASVSTRGVLSKVAVEAAESDLSAELASK